MNPKEVLHNTQFDPYVTVTSFKSWHTGAANPKF